MSQPPAHYVVLALPVQLILFLVSVSLPLSSRLCLGQPCYDCANQPESSHWFVIITPLEGFGGGSSGCRSAAGNTQRMEGKTGNGRHAEEIVPTDSMRLHLLYAGSHRQPHNRAENMFYSLEYSFEFLMKRAKAAIIQTQQG